MQRTSDRVECPPEFQRHLTDIFGVNRFGDPLFRFIWGMTETEIMLTPFGTYEERLIGNNKPCWILQQWEPAEAYGTPELFYYLNTDLDSGLPVMMYPEFGRYKDFMTFLFKEYKHGQLNISTIDLGWVIIDRAIPLMIKSLEMSGALLKAQQEEYERIEEQAVVTKIADRMADALPSFYGPTSYAVQQIRQGKLDRKMEEIEKEWRKHNLRKQPMRGFFQKN